MLIIVTIVKFCQLSLKALVYATHCLQERVPMIALQIACLRRQSLGASDGLTFHRELDISSGTGFQTPLVHNFVFKILFENSKVLIMSTQGPIHDYKNLLQSCKFLFIVCTWSLLSDSPSLKPADYRGHWCPFCTSYLSTLNSLSPEISSYGGRTVAITSELEEHVPSTRKSSGYDGEVIIDPENKLVKYFKEKNMAEVAISSMEIAMGLRKYEFGMAQPAILVVGREEEVLESWAIVPNFVCPHLSMFAQN